MSQKLVLMIVGLVVIIGGVWYYKTSVSNPHDAEMSTSQGSDAEKGGLLDTMKGKVGSFADVLTGGDAVECSFSGIDPETKEHVKGTVQVDGENFRMRADTVIEGKDAVVNIIQKGKVMYMWSDDEEVMPGIVIDMSAFEDVEGSEPNESPIDWLREPDAGVDYDCDGWSPRSNSFEPPKDVEFVDMFGEMGNLMGGMLGEEMMKGEGMMGDSDESDDWSY